MFNPGGNTGGTGLGYMPNNTNNLFANTVNNTTNSSMLGNNASSTSNSNFFLKGNTMTPNNTPTGGIFSNIGGNSASNSSNNPVPNNPIFNPSAPKQASNNLFTKPLNSSNPPIAPSSCSPSTSIFPNTNTSGTGILGTSGGLGNKIANNNTGLSANFTNTPNPTPKSNFIDLTSPPEANTTNANFAKTNNPQPAPGVTGPGNTNANLVSANTATVTNLNTGISGGTSSVPSNANINRFNTNPQPSSTNVNPTPNLFANMPLASTNSTANLFTAGTNANNPPATSAITNNPPPPTNTQTAPSNPASTLSGGLFGGNKPATTNPLAPAVSRPATNPQPTTTGTTEAPGFFGAVGTTPPVANTTITSPSTPLQPTNNLSNQSMQPTQMSATGGVLSTGTTGAPSGTTNVSQTKDDIQAQFDKSNQTVAEFIDDFRKNFIQAYTDLQKLTDNTIKYLEQREENTKIVNNFKILEPMIASKSDFASRSLDYMEKQQDEIEKAITMMQKRLGEGTYKHQISRHLQEYYIMREEVIKLDQERSVNPGDSSNQQLSHIFQNLNEIQMQIREMDDQVDRYMFSLNSYL